MSKHVDDVSALFRSIEPDDAQHQRSEVAAVREAEQRWPLFKALPLHKPEPTPPLSAEEKQQWQPHPKANADDRKPALSVQGFSKKMADSLRKMSPAQTPVARSPDDRIAPKKQRDAMPEHTRTEDIPNRKLTLQSAAHFARRVAGTSVPPLAAQSPPVISGGVLSDHVDQNAPRRSQGRTGNKPALNPIAGLRGRLPKTASQENELQRLITNACLPVPVKRPVSSDAAHADRSLANLFERLAEKTDVVDTPPTKRSAFLFKLNKR